MAIFTADQIADTIIEMSRDRGIEITNLKLQKLLYYTQAWSLVLRGEPLFAEDFEAWIHGPVVPRVFGKFKSNRWNPIQETVYPVRNPEILAHITKVLNTYGNASPNQLELLSHSESPWIEARANIAPTEPSKAMILKESMKVFYSGLRNAAKNRVNS